MRVVPQRVVIASGNQGKLREIQSLLAPLGIEVCPQADFGIDSPPEDGDSFIENALIKARHASRKSGLSAIADDSGLAVDALHGAPGVYSARFAGTDATDADNNSKLLAELGDLPEEQRGAAFHCAAVFVASAADGSPLIEVGIWRGRIARVRSGTGGFGYDPLFYDPEAGCCSAELDAAQKNARSHRGKAFRALRDALAERWT